MKSPDEQCPPSTPLKILYIFLRVPSNLLQTLICLKAGRHIELSNFNIRRVKESDCEKLIEYH